MCMDTKTIEEYPVNMKLAVQAFRGKLLVSSRDFLFLAQSILFPDGTIKLAVISVEDKRAPPAKPHVRGRVIIAGWILKPTKDGKTEATYITMADLAGSIPGFMQSMAAKKQTSIVQCFNDAYIKRYGGKK